ncbi:MAG: hypothetical protein A2W90_19620 [Bacteroidetes bacterium GWF2_42_66]|nr:MAG: hypothetical protein A2W92_17860 [Bacteroidetes bacterium GWA2_42_15]OFX98630.1 MAG: hypothetical protein A2W89_10075 [Bacteroidetes bacterium GWE2_42_39]OFY43173.1 MAG: hypothetical protein A2W90_19620 [Bacteroidetes bacterium GWF2_42_66]HBL76974.1 TonB-dependent receptor [Prolixibacteraceae bacterium]HCR89624.1 TonB-dependent receptor [Prolixibacteraceae bacterium]
MKNFTFFLFLFLNIIIVSETSAQSNNATIFGRISGENGEALEMVSISIKNYPIGTTTSRSGEYLLRVPAKKKITLVFSMVGYLPVEKEINASEEEKMEVNISLTKSDQQIDEVTVAGQRKNKGNVDRIDPKFLNNMPDAASGGVEALIKTLPGVSSNNELSSQYSVRGGNFDENLVYVNDIEVYRPFLVRAGQQEGLSFINSDMVSSIGFSAGGFDAKYGDKMSSVLDIKYRKPVEFQGSASVSILGGSFHLEDVSKNKKLSHISGFRYKTNRYMLNSLDEKGEYDPRFTDFQTYITCNFSPKFDVSFLGNLARNKYHFIPQTRETHFGTWNNAKSATIYFEGQEIDNFTTLTGALSANYHPNSNLNLKVIASAFNSKEKESYDIKGDYNLNELERDMSSEELGDVVMNLGTGTFINHARNSLNAKVFSIDHKGAFNSEEHLVNWGLKMQAEQIDDYMNEWIFRDSTGYSLPYSDEKVELFSSSFTDFSLRSLRFSGYIQDTYKLPVARGEMYLTAGIRGSWWDYNSELLISPRASLNFYPDWEANISFRLSAGVYNQPAFYRELKDLKGNINQDIKAQKSQQFVLGSEYIFQAWDRPFKLTSELYYKSLSYLIPYKVDNVRIRYLSDEEAKGYAAGIDLKVNGEFVSGIESWASLSVMQTEEDVMNDGHGYIPRPTDQTLNISMFFQDYFPGNPSYKMHLAAYFGSRLPTGPPNSERYMDYFRMPSYRRIDLGFSKILISEDHRFRQMRFLNNVKDMWLSLEVFNLLGINNTISYFWVNSNSGDQYGVPNYLTGRKVNLKLSIKF